MNEAVGNLVTLAKRGDHDAFRRLVDMHRRMAVGLAFAHTGNWEDAEDAAQEAFIRAHRSFDSLRESGKFPEWLAGIIRNICRDTLRGNSRRMKLQKLLELGQAEESWKQNLWPNPLEGSREKHAELLEALKEVPEAYRETLVLRYVDGRNHQNISEMLGLSYDGVDSRLKRGRSMLKEIYQRKGTHTGD